jgi:hypothetical protein
MGKVRPVAHMHTALRSMSHLRVVMRESKRERERERETPQSSHEKVTGTTSEARRVRFLGGGRGWGCGALEHRPMCLCARGVFHINRQEYTRAHTRQNTCTHTTLPSCAPPPPKRRRRVTFDGNVRNLELRANSSCLQIDSPYLRTAEPTPFRQPTVSATTANSAGTPPRSLEPVPNEDRYGVLLGTQASLAPVGQSGSRDRSGSCRCCPSLTPLNLVL